MSRKSVQLMKKNITVYFYLDFSTLAKLFFALLKKVCKRGCNLYSKVLLSKHGQRKNVIEDRLSRRRNNLHYEI